jgi:quinol-cytochrome oxidoreductase complex cytochrome b subunit
MGDTQQPQPAGTGATGAEAAAELAEIQRRQEQVIKAVLVPVWYWWVIAAGIVAIGAARDSGNLTVEAITIPLAALVMVVLTGAMIPELRRRVKVHTPQTSPRAAFALIGMIVLVDGVILGTAASLHAAHLRYPGTIGCAAGAAVLVIAGPLLNRYSRKLMQSQVRRQMNGAPEAGGGTP